MRRKRKVGIENYISTEMAQGEISKKSKCGQKQYRIPIYKTVDKRKAFNLQTRNRRINGFRIPKAIRTPYQCQYLEYRALKHGIEHVTNNIDVSEMQSLERAETPKT